MLKLCRNTALAAVVSCLTLFTFVSLLITTYDSTYYLLLSCADFQQLDFRLHSVTARLITL